MAPLLLTPLKLGQHTLANRVIMAPMSRARATLPLHIPNDMMAEYYAQRASGGLIIAEATAITPDCWAFYGDPGVFSHEQVEGWKKTTDAVHKKNGLIFLQLWHGGRACHPSHNPIGEGHKIVYDDGALETAAERHADLWKKIDPTQTEALPLEAYKKYFNEAVGPSSIAIEHRDMNSIVGVPLKHPVPRTLTDHEVQLVVKAFATGANNAMIAGFDGVEIHAANGYIISQFLMTSSNKRKKSESVYHGESLEGRTRLFFEVVDATIAAIAAAKKVSTADAASRVGVRISSLNSFNSQTTEDPIEMTACLVAGLKARRVGYLHALRRDIFTRNETAEANFLAELKKFRDPSATDNCCRLILNMGFDAAEGEKAVHDGDADAISYGNLFLANPDLPERFSLALKCKSPEEAKKYFNQPNQKGMYRGGVEGLIDYSFLKDTPVVGA